MGCDLVVIPGEEPAGLPPSVLSSPPPCRARQASPAAAKCKCTNPALMQRYRRISPTYPHLELPGLRLLPQRFDLV